MPVLTVYIVRTERDRVFDWDPKVQLDPPEDLAPEDWQMARYRLPDFCRIGKNTIGGTSVFRGDRYVPIVMNQNRVCMIDSTVDDFRYLPLEEVPPEAG